MKYIKRCLSLILIISIAINISIVGFCEETNGLGLSSKSAILMEAQTGKILYEENSHEKLLPASVTKIMTLLLIMESIDSGKTGYEDLVTISEYAASMGGSQVYLSPGEQLSVHEMLKAITVSSGNDASVAMAEHICGSESEFISQMNKRAKELGMNDTIFNNTTGLDDEEPYNITSANDIALMSRELITKHPKIFEYTTIWIDTIRNGKFGLSNTNKLIRFYPGANGLKTGSTSKAKFNISATAKRDNLQLISVVMGEPSSAIRNEDCKKMFNLGFANYRSISVCKKGDVLRSIQVEKGTYQKINIVSNRDVNLLIKKGDETKISSDINLQTKYMAPLKEGEKLGELVYKINGEEIGRYELVAQKSIEKVNVYNAFIRIINAWMSI